MSEIAQASKQRLELDYGHAQSPESTMKNVITDVVGASRDRLRNNRNIHKNNEGFSLQAMSCVNAADEVSVSLLRKLPQKAKHVLRMSVKQGFLSASALSILISSGCGNIEIKSVEPETIESIPSSAPATQEITPKLNKEQELINQAFDDVSFCRDKIKPRLGLFRLPSTESLDESDSINGQWLVHGEKIYIKVAENIDWDTKTTRYNRLGIEKYSDYLKYVVYHDCGHAIDDYMLKLAYPEEYDRIIQAGVADYLREKRGPLYKAFAVLEGWELDEKSGLYNKKSTDSRMEHRGGNLAIAEQFAELFGLYVSGSPVLTDREKKFFEKIKIGFEKNPKIFSESVAQDPMMLLRE